MLPIGQRIRGPAGALAFGFAAATAAPAAAADIVVTRFGS